MSEHITHVAACQDVTRLIAAMPDAIPEPIRRAMTQRADAAQLGSITRRLDFFSVPLLNDARARAEAATSGGQGGGEGGGEADGKLAFVLGGLTHRSADRFMKPVFDHFKQAVDASKGYNEVTIYCDVKILQEVYNDNPTGPYPIPADLLDPGKSASTKGLEELMRGVLRRTLISMHTFKPDTDHADAWVAGLLQRAQDFKIRLDHYVQVANDPDPDKVQRYLVETNYYDADDPIIKAARRLQAGDDMTESDIAAAVKATDAKSSRYAQLVGGGVGYIQAVGEYFEHRIDDDTLSQRLDIGVPELSRGFDNPASAENIKA